MKLDITEKGVLLPNLRKGKTFRPVLKVSFTGDNDVPIPDPWLLAAKAAVNLSSTRGQKLLPACDKPEEEDYEILLEFHKYQMSRRQENIPGELNLSSIGDMPGTPLPVAHSDVAVATPPKEEDDWENLGD